MKATELMIGDLLQVKASRVNENHEIEDVFLPVKVVEVRDAPVVEHIDPTFKKAGYQILRDLSILQAIPLTAEILKKNGFEEEHGYREIVYLYSNDFYNICIHLKERNYTNGAYTFANISHGCTFIEELQTNYVHELQHAMRMCNIEKEIEL